MDSGKLGINKINILLGANSSGKSTFVRLFPMFTESSKHELRGPLLWSDEDYDYGSFEKALCNKADEGRQAISFSFCLDLNHYLFPKNLSGVKTAAIILTENQNPFLQKCFLMQTQISLNKNWKS